MAKRAGWSEEVRKKATRYGPWDSVPLIPWEAPLVTKARQASIHREGKYKHKFVE